MDLAAVGAAGTSEGSPSTAITVRYRGRRGRSADPARARSQPARTVASRVAREPASTDY
jgi:hypothetical protein